MMGVRREGCLSERELFKVSRAHESTCEREKSEREKSEREKSEREKSKREKSDGEREKREKMNRGVDEMVSDRGSGKKTASIYIRMYTLKSTCIHIHSLVFLVRAPSRRA